MPFTRHQAVAVTPAASPSALPDPLHEALFGGGLRCYVLLDGGRIAGIEALLALMGASGQSLFRGDALEAYAQAGPWLVELQPAGRLAGCLFTASKAPQHLWGKLHFVVLRSDADAATLIAHFRRYIRLRRSDGSHPLFRFWDGQVLCDYFDGCAAMPQRAARFFGAQGDRPLVAEFLLATQDGAGLERFRLDGTLPPEAQVPDPSLTDADEAVLRAAVDRRIVARVEGKLAARFGDIDPAQAHHANSYARGAMAFVRQFGTGHMADIEKDCFQLALVAFLLGPSWRVVADGPMMREPLVPMSQRIAMLRESYFAALEKAPVQGER